MRLYRWDFLVLTKLYITIATDILLRVAAIPPASLLRVTTASPRPLLRFQEKGWSILVGETETGQFILNLI
jgi:hypothetical protein